MHIRRSRAGRLIVLILGLALSTTLLAAPASAKKPKYPSWSDVQQAKKDVSTKKSEIKKITGLLHDLQDKAAKLGDEAIDKQADYDAARGRLNDAETKVANLSDKLDQAKAQQSKVKKKVSALAVQSYKSGGSGPSPSVMLLLDPSKANKVLDGRSNLSLLRSRNAKLLKRAQRAKHLTEALTEQAESAKQQRQRLASAAEQKYEAAKAAKERADAEVAHEKKTSKKLVSQLASLKDRTVKVEKQYQKGVAARKAYRAKQRAARRAAAKRKRAAERRKAEQASSSSSSSSSSSPGGSGSSSQSSPAVSHSGGGSPSSAKSYAKARLGAYGWSSGQYGCLLKLWTQESSWSMNAVNPSSHAYGIPQSLPASKMASAGADWRTNYRTQINWGLGYISARYGSPCGAWSHEVSHNWY